MCHSDGLTLCGVVRGAGGESSEHRVLAARVLLEGPEGVRGRGSDREEARDGRGGRLGVVGHVGDDDDGANAGVVNGTREVRESEVDGWFVNEARQTRSV